MIAEATKYRGRPVCLPCFILRANTLVRPYFGIVPIISSSFSGSSPRATARSIIHSPKDSGGVFTWPGGLGARLSAPSPQADMQMPQPKQRCSSTLHMPSTIDSALNWQRSRQSSHPTQSFSSTLTRKAEGPGCSKYRTRQRREV